MTDFRQKIPCSFEEVIRAAIIDYMGESWHSMPCIVSKSTEDGHTTVLQPTVNGRAIDVTGKVTNPSYPNLLDVPIHSHQGGKMAHTMPTLQGDEVLAIFSSRNIDSWHQNGGSNNNPIDDRVHSLSDAMMIHGYRSDPRKLKNVAKNSSQVRSEDQSQMHDIHPTNGHSMLASKPEQGSNSGKTQTLALNKDNGFIGTSENLIQHIVQQSSTTIQTTAISHKSPKILLNC